MKETKVYTWCDNHQPVAVEALATRTIALDGGPARGLDLCEQCEKELLAGLTELLDSFGQIPVPIPPSCGHPGPGPSQGASRERRETCQFCQEELLRHSLIGHIYSLHSSVTPPSGVTTCPDCGFEARVQGVGAHRSSIHGYDPVVAAYAAARANPR